MKWLDNLLLRTRYSEEAIHIRGLLDNPDDFIVSGDGFVLEHKSGLELNVSNIRGQIECRRSELSDLIEDHEAYMLYRHYQETKNKAIELKKELSRPEKKKIFWQYFESCKGSK